MVCDMKEIDDESLGKFFTRLPDDEQNSGSNIDPEILAQYQNVVDNFNLLSQMEEIDSQKAIREVKIRIGKRKGAQMVSIVQKIAAVLLLPLLIFAVWQSRQMAGFRSEIVQNEISTPPTLRSVFILPDGTKVWMNGGTTLKYPTQFSGNERLVELNGEAYFKVAHNKRKPFRVKTGKLYVEAVGTEFNCKAFSYENKMETLLTEGKINLLVDDTRRRKVLATLEPGQMLTYYKSEQKFSRKKVDAQKYTAWIEGKIIFRNDHLQDVLNHLEHWYNVEFIIDTGMHLDYAFTGSFEGEELNQLLRYIELTTPVRFNVVQSSKSSNDINEKTKIKIKTTKK